MTKNIASLFPNNPIQTELPGVFIKDLPAKVMEQEFGNLNQLLNEDPEAGITKLFQGLICDADGNPFEDCQTYEAITATLSVASIKRIVTAAGKALMGEDATGNA